MGKFIVILAILTILLSGCVSQSENVPVFSETASAQTTTNISRFRVGAGPGSLEIADFNGDGKYDVVVANEESNDATVLLGDGKGGFAGEKTVTFASGKMPNDIAVADFNKDKKLDLAFANHETDYLTVLLGNGQGNFKPSSKSPFKVQVKPHPHGVATADFNGDGILDLVTDSWENDRLAVLYGDGQGNFTASPRMLQVGRHPYQRVRVADVNKDGNADVLTTNLRGNNLTVLLGDGKGGFKEHKGSPFASGDSPIFLAYGDLNADGKLDLAIANSPSNSTSSGKDGLTILLGDDKGNFKTIVGSPFATGAAPTRLAIGDVNGDRFPDVVVSNLNSNSISLFLMNGKGGVLSSSTINAGKEPKGIAIQDLNGDGKGEIVVANYGDNNILIIPEK